MFHAYQERITSIQIAVRFSLGLGMVITNSSCRGAQQVRQPDPPSLLS
jgi:hypothetical protein